MVTEQETMECIRSPSDVLPSDERISFSPDQIQSTNPLPCISLDESIILTEMLPKMVTVTSEYSSRNDVRSPTLTRLSHLSSNNDPKTNIWLSALSVIPPPVAIEVNQFEMSGTNTSVITFDVNYRHHRSSVVL